MPLITDDEYGEITPKSIRLRKKFAGQQAPTTLQEIRPASHHQLTGCLLSALIFLKQLCQITASNDSLRMRAVSARFVADGD